MLLKIYNQNGKVKVTKTSGYLEQTMFSNLQDGEIAEIEIGVSQYTKSCKAKISESEMEDLQKETPAKEESTDAFLF